MGEITSLTRKLVGIPSYEDETEAGDAIEGWLRDETDAAVERDGAGNVIARLGGTGTALVGHHDTVPPAEGQVDGGSPVCELRDGRLYGRGTADMKGALAAAMVAFRDAEGDDVAFASFVGEETGGVGAMHAVENGFVPDRAVVLEGSNGYSSPDALDVAVAHRGRREVRVSATGEARHAGEGGGSGNAVYPAVDAINRIRRYETPEVEVKRGSLELSVSVTVVRGGDEGATNVVPSRCEFVVDERTVPGDDGYPWSELSSSGASSGSVETTVADEMPPMECDDMGFACLVRDSAREGGASEFVTKPHATDAGHLARGGSSCVVCGPAERGEAHTDDESVSVAALERAESVYRRVLGSP